MRSQKNKYIEFYALGIDEEAVVKVEELKKLYKLDVWDELQCIGDSACSPLELIDVYSQVPSTHTGRAIAVTDYNFERVEDVKQYVLVKLRDYVTYLTQL
ncbi:hypothetical protein D3C74_99100 [compost metagenome]